MNSNDLDKILDSAVDSIRDERMEPTDEQRVTDEVWREVETAHAALQPDVEQEDGGARIRDCADFQAVVPAYLRNSLSEAKALLLEDHVGECLPCRKALNEARARHSRPIPAVVQQDSSQLATWGWRVAVAAVIFVALIGVGYNSSIFSIQTGGMITIENLEGEVMQVTDEGINILKAGDVIRTSDSSPLRTGKGSRAMLRLEDGSLVEMDERAELAVKNRRPFWALKARDRVIDLERGGIIVEAAQQIDGHLYVNTDEADISVTGTTFSVNHGMKGSRVSVIEGEVHVDHSGTTDVLLAGNQTTTNDRLDRVPVADEIEWSQNRDRHMAVLAELTRISREIENEIQGPATRYSTTLLDRAPADTVIYVGVPNIAETLSNSYVLLQEKVQENSLLNEWWEDSVVAGGLEEDIERMMGEIEAWGGELGDEIALTLQTDASGEIQEPVILSTLHRPASFGAFVTERINRISDEVGEDRPNIAVIENDSVAPADADMYVAIRGDLVAFTPERTRIEAFTGNLRGPSPATFVGQPFHGRLAELYVEGVEWVIGIDVASLVDADDNEDTDDSFAEVLGIDSMQHIIAERKAKGDQSESRMVLTYDEPDRGLASWLAAPAPMGSLDFISPNANLVAAFAMEDSSSAVEHLLQKLAGDDSQVSGWLEEFEGAGRASIIDDVSTSIGGEFAFAIDGPLLPVPSWKLIMEVYEPATLQMTLEWAVGQLNGLAAENDMQGFRIKRQGPFYEFNSLDTGLSAHYTYSNGYMVVAASRSLVRRALQTRASGVTLSDSSKFVSLLPDDGQAHFSAVVFQDLGSVVGPVARQLQGMANEFNGPQQEIVAAFSGVMKPSLTVAYGEPSRILFVHTTEGGLFSSGLMSLLSLDHLMNVQELLDHAARAGDQHALPSQAPASNNGVDQQNRT